VQVRGSLFDYMAEDGGKVDHQQRVSASSGPSLRRRWVLAGKFCQARGEARLPGRL
jgi:hypothetical protein